MLWRWQSSPEFRKGGNYKLLSDRAPLRLTDSSRAISHYGQCHVQPLSLERVKTYHPLQRTTHSQWSRRCQAFHTVSLNEHGNRNIKLLKRSKYLNFSILSWPLESVRRLINVVYFANLIDILAPLPQMKPRNWQSGHVFLSNSSFQLISLVYGL